MRSGYRLPWETTGEDNTERFTALWHSGMPTRRMAKTLEISISTLWKVRKRLGLPPRGAPGALTARLVDPPPVAQAPRSPVVAAAARPNRAERDRRR